VTDRKPLDERVLSFYKKLFQLATCDDLAPLLKAALEDIVEVAGAERAYIELFDDRGRSRLHFSHRCDGAEGPDSAAPADALTIEKIRARFSSGVIAEALALGEVYLNNALGLSELRDRGSVRSNRIERVICAPIVTPNGDSIGVVYLQNSLRGTNFTEDHKTLAGEFASHLGVLADRLLLKLSEAARADATLEERRIFPFPKILGTSAAVGMMLRSAGLAAKDDSPVLLTGQSGTGKTMLAEQIHAASSRAKGPFVRVNCPAITEALFESEFFGTGKGVATGVEAREGKIAAAEGGTLFLDEIAEIDVRLQSKLLQFLDSRTYSAVGTNEVRRADVRVIAATNVDIAMARAERKLRDDLYFRLNSTEISVPSLADRPEDIRVLAKSFLAQLVPNHALAFGQQALLKLEASDWPGNVRELEGAVRTAVRSAQQDGALTIELRHLRASMSQRPTPTDFHDAVDLFREQLVKRALEECDWNVTKAAVKLGLSRAQLNNLIKAFGLKRR
jgi:Nif-specific regulatory protein